MWIWMNNCFLNISRIVIRFVRIMLITQQKKIKITYIEKKAVFKEEIVTIRVKNLDYEEKKL